MFKRLFYIGLVYIMSLVANAQQNILIYAGPGVGPQSLANTVAMFNTLVADKYPIVTVGPEVLIDPTWQKTTALLVMPGGADLPYLKSLRGVGNANIRNYVQNGGKYLGICAGAYYSADRIEFAKGDPKQEVSGERELKFFPGLVSGPTFSGFDVRDVNNYAGTRAANLHWQDNQVHVFYNGGGHFVDADKYANISILARYDEEIPAIVECRVGKGLAILSGPHFEWEPSSLDANAPYLDAIVPVLSKDNPQRLELAAYIINRLGL